MSANPFTNLVFDHRAGLYPDHHVDLIAVPLPVREYTALLGRHGRTSIFDGEILGDMLYDRENARASDCTGRYQQYGVAAWQYPWNHWSDLGTR